MVHLLRPYMTTEKINFYTKAEPEIQKLIFTQRQNQKSHILPTCIKKGPFPPQSGRLQMNQVVPKSPAGQLHCKNRGGNANSCFFFLLLKSHLVTQSWNLGQWGLVCCSRLQCSTVSTISVETRRSSRTPKLHHIQRYQLQKPKDTNKSFQDKEDWNIETRTKGEVKGGGTERTENETERLPFPPTTVGVYSDPNLYASRKGPLRREHPAHCPPG